MNRIWGILVLPLAVATLPSGHDRPLSQACWNFRCQWVPLVAAPSAVAEDSHCCFLDEGFVAVKTQKANKAERKKRSNPWYIHEELAKVKEYFPFYFAFFMKKLWKQIRE